MYKFSIVVGTQYNQYGQVLPRENWQVVEETVLASIAREFGGFTLTSGSGGYVYKNGYLVIEESTTINILSADFNYQFVKDASERIKALMEQESVILSWNKLDSVEFI